MILKNKYKGIVLLVTATLFYSLYGLFSRLIGEEFGAIFQAIARNFIIFLLLGFFLLMKKSWQKIASQDYKWFLLMEIPGLIAIIAIFMAFNHLNLSTAIFLMYVMTTITSYFLGFLFFQEKLNRAKKTSLIICFIGLYLLFSKNITSGSLIYLSLACLAGIGTACWNIFSKKLSLKYQLNQILFINLALSIILGLPLLFIFKQPVFLPQLSLPWLAILVFSLVTLLATWLTVNGFRYLEAQMGSLIMLLEPVFASLIGFLFFQEKLTFLSLLGGALVLIGAGLPNLKLKPNK